MNNKNVVPGSISEINIVGNVDRQNGLHKRESVAWHYNSFRFAFSSTYRV